MFSVEEIRDLVLDSIFNYIETESESFQTVSEIATKLIIDQLGADITPSADLKIVFAGFVSKFISAKLNLSELELQSIEENFSSANKTIMKLKYRATQFTKVIE